MALDAVWLTPAVRTLAQTLYDERRFKGLSALADALADERCGRAELVGHLRSGGEHALGCWAVDAVLGKSCSRRHGGNAEGHPDGSGRPSWLWGVYSETWEEEGSRALADDKVTG